VVEDGSIELKRVLGTCCPEPECDYISFPVSCPACGADCMKCDLRRHRWAQLHLSKMTEGQALYSIGVRATEKDGKKGMSMPIPGKPGETIFIEASDEKPGAIVASEHKESRLKGAKKTRCADCRCKVWISPSTQEMLKRYPGVPVICIACFVKRAEEEKKQEKEAKP